MNMSPILKRSHFNPRRMTDWNDRHWGDYYMDLSFDEWTIRNQPGITKSYIKSAMEYLMVDLKNKHCR